MHALVIEDNSAIATSVDIILTSDGFVCDTVELGEEGYASAKRCGYDIIILDLMLPDIDGYEVLRRLRKTGVCTPVLILSGLNDAHDRIKGLGFGADDFLGKPFDRRELIARVQAVLRRAKGHPESVIRTGKLEVDLGTQTVQIGGKPLHLTRKEYGILELLSRRKGFTLTKKAFLDHLYGGIDEPEMKIIDVFVCKLRQKLSNATGGENYIETDWNRGYMLRDPLSDSRAVESAVSQ